MSENNSLISSENLPTVTAVAFVLALLALALNAMNYMRTNEVATAVAAFEVGNSQERAAARSKAAATVTALEARVAELEAQAKAAPPPAEPAATADAAE